MLIYLPVIHHYPSVITCHNQQLSIIIHHYPHISILTSVITINYYPSLSIIIHISPSYLSIRLPLRPTTSRNICETLSAARLDSPRSTAANYLHHMQKHSGFLIPSVSVVSKISSHHRVLICSQS